MTPRSFWRGFSPGERSRPWILALAGSAGTFLLLELAFSGVFPEIAIFDRVEEMESLKAVLDDGDSDARLRELLECLPIHHISVGLTGGESWRFANFFDFAPSGRTTARTYRVIFWTEADGTNGLRVADREEFYATLPWDTPPPAVTSGVTLRILRLVLSNRSLANDLVEWMNGTPDGEIRHLTIAPGDRAGEPPRSGEPFVLGAHSGGNEGEPGTRSVYFRLSYDAAADAVTVMGPGDG